MPITEYLARNATYFKDDVALVEINPEVGNIPRSLIIGRAWLRLYPFNEFGLLTDK